MRIEQIGSSKEPSQTQRRPGDIMLGNEYVWGKGSAINISQLVRDVKGYWESRYSDGAPTSIFTLARRAIRAASLYNQSS